MNNQQTFYQAALSYRDFPLLDAKFIDADTRADIKQIFALILSQRRLKESMRDHLMDEYSETSPFLATLTTRLIEVEQRLIQFEGKYGKLSEIEYTIQ